jgi:hypothetical protein
VKAAVTYPEVDGPGIEGGVDSLGGDLSGGLGTFGSHCECVEGLWSCGVAKREVVRRKM